MSADPGQDKTSSTPRRNSRPDASNPEEPAKAEAEPDGGVGEIVDACRRGEPAAQRRLYDTFNRNVFRLMVRMVGMQEAEDLTQQVFLQVFRTIGQYSGRGGFRTWLYRLAMNESLQHLRRSKRWRHHELAYEPEDKSVRAEQRTERKELLEQALARLEPELRSITLLREIEDLSYREIAEALQIPEGTVGSRLNRARRELKGHLLGLGWEP